VDTELLRGFYLGQFLVDPRQGQIIGAAGTTHLPPKAMEVLLRLAAKPGKLVTRQEFLDAVWGPGEGRPEALNHAISEIRHALDDHRDQPDFIQTLPKRGYRLLVDVTPASAHTGSVVLGTKDGPRMQELSLFENLRRRGVLETAIAYFVVGWLLIQIGDVVFDRLLLPWVGTFVTLLVIAGFPIAILLSWFLEFRHGRAVPHELTPKELLDRRFSRTYVSVISALAAAGVLVFIYDRTIGLPQAEDAAPQGILEQMTLPPIQQNSIAVLPFLNIDGSEQTEIFANGLADDLINSLARIPGMLVSARGDSFTLEPNSASERVRKRLRVALYLEGSVQIESTIMRVIVQLIDSKTGFHIYSRTFDRPLSGYFEMRDEIAELTVSNVRVALPHESQLLPSALNEVSDINAYVLFRRGKEIYEQPHTIESLSNVIDYYDEALAIDPEYAAAHAGKCAAFVELYNISKESLDIDHAEAACTAALTTSPRLGVVYTALGMLYRKTNRNSEAEKAFGDAPMTKQRRS
jgi:TolB-like protein/DNA-binding winged helix-turn-helix (wHTH) protein